MQQYFNFSRLGYLVSASKKIVSRALNEVVFGFCFPDFLSNSRCQVRVVIYFLLRKLVFTCETRTAKGQFSSH